MKFREYLRDQVFRKKLERNPCLVIYDAPGRYREVARELAGSKCKVIEIAEEVIEPREEAIQALQDLAKGKITQLVLWIAAKAPADDRARQKDLFAVFGLVGSLFPMGDGETLQALCNRAYPNHTADIARLFGSNEPTFAMIDSLEGGSKYPHLYALLQTSSSKDLILRLLMKESDQKLKDQTGWVKEAKSFVQEMLGYTLKPKGETRAIIGNELWRLLLVSEFAFDCQEPLPKELHHIPMANFSAKDLIFDLCNDLRQHNDYRSTYLETAAKVEEEYGLKERCSHMRKLGMRDTFAFEERLFFTQAVDFVLADNLEDAEKITKGRENSVWRNQNDDAKVRWDVLKTVLELITVAKNLPGDQNANLTGLVGNYANHWRNLDRCYRELEQIMARGFTEDDAGMNKLVISARKTYRAAMDPIQANFINKVKEEGWAPAGSPFLRNSQIFDKVVKPLLDANERVGYMLLDSLRMELGVELGKLLQQQFSVEVKTVWAQLPTYTEVGMASLMPEAASQLKMIVQGDTLVTTLGGTPATEPKTRFAYLKGFWGDRCSDMELDTLTELKKPKVEDKIRLLLVRSYELDSTAHASTSGALNTLPGLLRKVQQGVHRLAEMGFTKVIIATDHGFLLIPESGPGQTVTRPAGKWLVQKTRCQLGKGVEDSGNVLFSVGHIGLTADCTHYAVPKTLALYTKGESYTHEGLSLQEAVLPCMIVDLRGWAKSKPEKIKLEVSYKQGKKSTITTQIPSLELRYPGQADLFASKPIEVAVEVTDALNGNQVGEVSSGSSVNMATKCIRIEALQTVSFSVRMEPNFEGSFKVRVIDPSTQVVFSELTLKTDYL